MAPLGRRCRWRCWRRRRRWHSPGWVCWRLGVGVGDDDAVAEQIVKKETKATIRCFPFDEQHRSDGQKCFMTGRPATHMALFARAF